MNESESKTLIGSLLDAVWFFFSLSFEFLVFCFQHPILTFNSFIGTRRIDNVKWTYRVCFGSVRALNHWTGGPKDSGFLFGEKNKVEVYAIILRAERLPSRDWADPRQRIFMPIFIGSAVRGIGGSLFYNQDMLRSIELPLTLVAIGPRAFQGCSSLERIEIKWNPENDFTVHENAFADCSSLKELVVKKSRDSRTDEHSGCFHITSHAFKNCTSLAKVELIPNVSIWDNAFDGCSSLEDIILPRGVSFVGNAFANCQNLHSITIDEEDFISLKKSTHDDIVFEKWRTEGKSMKDIFDGNIMKFREEFVNKRSKEPQPTDDQILKFLGAPASCRLVIRSKGDSSSCLQVEVPSEITFVNELG